MRTEWLESTTQRSRIQVINSFELFCSNVWQFSYLFIQEEYPDDWAIEYQSRELVAAMLHRKRREQAVATVYGDSLEREFIYIT